MQSVDVSVDGGKTWYPAQLNSLPEPICTVRFSFPWIWDGKPADPAKPLHRRNGLRAADPQAIDRHSRIERSVRIDLSPQRHPELGRQRSRGCFQCSRVTAFCAALLVAAHSLSLRPPSRKARVIMALAQPVDAGRVGEVRLHPADGRGLPPGSGNATAGAKVYADNCAACHGDKLQGNPAKGIGGDRLTRRPRHACDKTPIKTVESYWPYATTLFDYVKRAMPFSAPGSLNDDDIYAVVAYILSEAKIIKPTDTMNATTLPKVVMPNRDGFIPRRPSRVGSLSLIRPRNAGESTLVTV